MNWTSRWRRLRVPGAISATIALGAGLVFASAVAGHSPRASANPTGASPGVYEAAIGNVDTLPLSTLQAGTSVSGPSSSVIYGPVGVNVNATKVLVGQEPSVPGVPAGPPEVGVIDVQGNVRSPAVPLAGKAIAVAMDPVNANVAFVLEANANAEALVQEVNMGASPPGGPAVTSLGAGLQVFAPTSIGISPSGATLFVGGTVGDGFFGIEATQVANPTQSTVWSAQSNGSVTFAAGGVVSLALSPDGLSLYGVATSGTAGGNAAIFDLGLPLTAGEKVTWFHPTTFTPTAVTINPNGDTVYAGGASGPGSDSIVQAFAAPTGTPGIQSKPIPMRAGSSAAVGLTSMAVTPDGGTLLATGTDGTTPTSPVVVVYPLGLPNLGIGARTSFGNLSSSATASPAIAITPDQAPVAKILAPTSVEVNQTVTFDASASTVAYGSVSSFVWQFGDGTTASGMTVTHAYSAPKAYTVTLTETDHAGTGLTTGVAGVSGPVAGPGQTPFRLASVSARTTVTIGVTPPPPTLTTPPTTPLTVPVLTSPTTPTPPTSAPRRPVPVPTLTLNPGVGPPGTIVTVTGAGFPPNTPVTVAWSTSTGSVVIMADAQGNLPPSQLDILTPDVLGPRDAVASSTPPASAAFLVVPSDSEPGGGSGDFLFRSEGP
jgi:chitodextrinase